MKTPRILTEQERINRKKRRYDAVVFAINSLFPSPISVLTINIPFINIDNK